MASQRGSRKKSRRRRGMFPRGRAAAAVVLLSGLAVGIWGLTGGFSSAQSSSTTPDANAVPTSASGDSPSSTSDQAAPAPVKGLSVAEAKAFADAARREIHPLRGTPRYIAIRSTWEKAAAMLDGPAEIEARKALLPLFHEISDILFFSEYRNEFSIVHVVKRGDTVERIARTYGVTEELICLWNKIEFNRRHQISEGQTFKIVAGSPRIVVSKEQFTLSYYFGERLARQYIIAHGVGNSTPVGQATVKSRIVDPDKGPHVGPMQREMAERWLGLTTMNDNGVPRDGIGIHGTKYEDSIPGESSHGCVRMFNRDVIELYNWVPHNMTVEIRA